MTQNIRTRMRNQVITDNYNLEPENFSTLFIQNIGATELTIDDNIVIPVGASWYWKNDPGVIIDDTLQLRFNGEGENKALIVKGYYL